MNNKQKGEAIRAIKRSINFIKSDLIRTSDKLRGISPREADKLDRIIFKLEYWQNR